MTRLRFVSALPALVLLVLGSAASAQKSPREQAAELTRACSLSQDAIVLREDKIIVLGDKLPDLEQSLACLWRITLSKPGWEGVVYTESESKIDAALEQERQAVRHRELGPQRIEKIERLLAAIKRGDRVAIEREGVLGRPYVLSYDQPTRAPQPTTTFALESLKDFAACTPSRPRWSNVQWYTVLWTCPEGTPQPWSSTGTSFKFDELDIMLIRTAPGPPMIKTVTPRAQRTARPAD